MPAASMKQLLESGVHFGHQTRRWNPKMKPFIFTERGGIHIIDLQKTSKLLDQAYDFARNIVDRGGSVLFVGTKKQCQDIIREEATKAGMPFVSHRWLGGLLTNYSTIQSRIKRLHELRRLKEDGSLELLPTKERMNLERELEKLEINLGGVANMDRLPDAVFIIDPKKEAIATREVNKLGLPLIGLVDTNCDPDEVDYIIPGNDDAIRSCSLIVKTMARAVSESKQMVTEEEMTREAQPAAEPEAPTQEAPTQEAVEAQTSEPPAPKISEAARRAAERKAPRAAQPKPGAKAKPEVAAPEHGETSGAPGAPGSAEQVVAPTQQDDVAERRETEAGETGAAGQEPENPVVDEAQAAEAGTEAEEQAGEGGESEAKE